MMKKYLILFVIITALNSCQKSNLQVNPNENLLDELTVISKLDFSGLTQKYGDICLSINPHGYVADKVEESFIEFNKLLKSNKSEGEIKSSDIVRLLHSKLPPDITKLSEEGFSDLEAQIYLIIISSISSDDFYTLNYRLACIENIVSSVECLNLHAKKRLLVYCASIKGIVNYFNSCAPQTKGETWEECFIRKQLEKMKSGIIEKLACVALWPECLGIMAADCLLEQIS